ncbi:aldo/keto reductase [[Clostridium] scindens]|uniref:aldo/keto reductase n=1 Tax=Clostridium scindens (strain JCM 10418 / VPI 12708) TaxID=29347 RepID=UPI001D07FA17|nr:aldo/keto reductase [[Clostridium] scindens]MCB6286262.1 aldo/keto reductase [[Clostridium] scindens]MCB6421018.1 aldo/keto reductase [[Clostridium] scindens]MCB7192777.1 aldo/keto reductase [[Clostridium] scindens]MCB7285961.1 aldo/keto reductase [[Clostridium] scindens]MCG4929911.1 aldo/keto reductase [[Clostridium] scindens]
MIYKEFQNISLSALGMGAMRLPIINGNDADIDEKATQEMIEYAMSQGINYYDTAWGYHNENSEIVMGKYLSKYPRDQYYFATKFPGYDLSNMPKVEEIFERQLEKCQVGYFDFYLFHNVCEMNIDAYLNEEYGIYAYLMEQKKNGRIKHLGFSAHGSYEVIQRFLDAYGNDMEFVQLQLNYLDWNLQDAKRKVELLNEHHIPVWVMEPLRGGKLAALSKENEKKLMSLRPEETIPAWAFRFLQTIPNVTMVLSGMSNFSQLKANIATFREERPLNEKEMEVLMEISNEMLGQKTLPCTGCHYCVSHCPKQLDIPSLISLYNEHCFTGGGFIAPMALMSYAEDKKPDSCIGCRSCEAVCPQQIKISKMMVDFVSKL